MVKCFAKFSVGRYSPSITSTLFKFSVRRAVSNFGEIQYGKLNWGALSLNLVEYINVVHRSVIAGNLVWKQFLHLFILFDLSAHHTPSMKIPVTNWLMLIINSEYYDLSLCKKTRMPWSLIAVHHRNDHITSKKSQSYKLLNFQLKKIKTSINIAIGKTELGKEKENDFTGMTGS